MVYEYEFIKHFGGTHFKTFFININHRLYHWHSDIELLLVIEGSVLVHTAVEQFELKKNDLFLINSNEIHSLSRTKESNTILALQFDPKFCSSYYPDLPRIKFTDRLIRRDACPEAWRELRQCLTDIVLEYYQKEYGYPLKLMSILNRMAYTLLKFIPHEKIDERILLDEEKKRSRLSRVIGYIQENYMNKTSTCTIFRILSGSSSASRFRNI